MYDQDMEDNQAVYHAFSTGPYRSDPSTGMFEPTGKIKRPRIDPDSNLPEMVNALLKGYVRKQRGSGYLPYTSAAPPGMVNQFRVLNRYNTYGVPYTGIPYGQKTDNPDDPFGNASY